MPTTMTIDNQCKSDNQIIKGDHNRTAYSCANKKDIGLMDHCHSFWMKSMCAVVRLENSAKGAKLGLPNYFKPL